MEFRQVIEEPWATPSMATPESCYHVKNKNKHNFQSQSKNKKLAKNQSNNSNRSSKPESKNN